MGRTLAEYNSHLSEYKVVQTTQEQVYKGIKHTGASIKEEVIR